MSLSEALFIDAGLLATATMLMYFAYNSGVRLARQSRAASPRFLLALRIVTLGVIIVLVYTVVDIPWNFISFYVPGILGVDALKYVFVYAIISSIIVFPAVNIILKAPLGERERERSALLSERDDLLQQLKIATSKYLKKEIGEDVFKEIGKDIQGKIIAVESKLEKLRIEIERKSEPRELFKI
jgi:membrane-associated HD superfamily phosphohydrolase